MEWCDYPCEHAGFDGTGNLSGSCRREIVMRCSKHEKLVKKNNVCIDDLHELLKYDPDYQRRFGKGGVA